MPVLVYPLRLLYSSDIEIKLQWGAVNSVMKKRNPFVVALLSLVTLGIYTIVWYVKTKGELVERGGEIPTAWLMIVPFANIYWLYQYFRAAEKVTAGRVKGLAFFMIIMISTVIDSVMTYDIGGPVIEVTSATNETVIDPTTLLVQLGLLLIYLSIPAYTQSSYNKITGETASPQPAPAEPTS